MLKNLLKDERALRINNSSESIRNLYTSFALGEMADATAHKLKNPLATMMMAATRLKRKLAESGEQDSILSVVDQLCRSITDYSEKIDEVVSSVELPELERLEVNINDILVSALGTVSDTMKAQRIEVFRELAAEIPTVQGNSEALKLVFLNVLEDSLSMIPSSGNLAVMSAATDDNQVQVVISDDRPNTDLLKLQKLLTKPFSTGGINASGLRLCVARRVLDLHSGTIRFRGKEKAGVDTVITLPTALG